MTSRPSKLDALRAELAAELRGTPAAPEPGSTLFRAVVVGSSGDDVVLELGPRVQGVVPAADFDTAPADGTTLALVLIGREDGLWIFSAREARTVAAWEEIDVGARVKARVTGTNKGGLELAIGSAEGFCPASQVAVGHADDLESLVGETLVCQVVEIDRAQRRVVVSRRAVLEEEARARREEALGALAPGAVLRGRVTRIESYGAFVDVGGVEGLLHVSELAHRRVEHPEEVVMVGEELEVEVLAVEEGGRRVSLSRKTLQSDPWDEALERLQENDVVTGTVRRLAEFGAFVELFPGVDGLLHVSRMGAGRVRRPGEVVRVGEELPVRIVSIDAAARRIGLSRTDESGMVLGSESAASAEELAAALEPERPAATNLGVLFKKALESKRGEPRARSREER